MNKSELKEISTISNSLVQLMLAHTQSAASVREATLPAITELTNTLFGLLRKEVTVSENSHNTHNKNTYIPTHVTVKNPK